jgi:hypothetical protein
MFVMGILQGVSPQPARAERKQTSSRETRHPVTDVWYTGPMLANKAATAPRGHHSLNPTSTMSLPDARVERMAFATAPRTRTAMSH